MGKGQSNPKHGIETEWIRSYARTYLPTEAGFSFAPAMLRAQGVSIIQIKHILRNAEVVYVNKLDDPGAEWDVVGEDQDGRQYRLELVVISEGPSVTLRRVSPHEELKEDSDDAA